MTYSQAYNTTLEQFASYQKAFEIQTVDSIHLMARNAWLNQSAKATKAKGKHIRSDYRNFQHFSDWDLEIQNLFTPQKKRRKLDRISEINRLMNEYIEKGGADDGV